MDDLSERRMDMVTLARTLGRLEASDNAIKEMMVRIHATLDTMPALVTDVVRLKADVAELRVTEAEFQSVKNKGIGIAIGLAAFGGAIGAGFSHFIRSVTGQT